MPTIEPHIDSYEEMKSSTDYLNDPVRLQRQLDEDGFVFLRSVIERSAIDDVKAEMEEFLAKVGLIEVKDGLPIWSGKQVEPGFDDTELYLKPSFVRLLEGDQLKSIVGRLFNEAAFVHRGPTIRYTIPKDVARQTPAHQDYFFIRGSTKFMTLWIPLMPIEREVGGLAVARASHRHGLAPHEELPTVFSTVFRDRNQVGVPFDRIPRPWCTADYAPGDLLAFNSHTIHWALPNVSARLRLSLDARCQPESIPTIWQMSHTIPEQRAYRRAVMAVAREEKLSDTVSEKVLLEMLKRGAEVDPTLIRALASELMESTASP